MAEVDWSDEARDDLDDIIAYIEQFDPVAANSYATRFKAMATSLSTFPHRGRPAADETREMTLVPPYIMRYRVIGSRVRILWVRHGRRQRDDG